MTWEDLLNELAVHVLRDRSALVAGPTDQLWSDRQLLSYLSDAQKRFARRTLMLRDGAASKVTRFNLETDKQEYVLNDKVLAILSAKLDGDIVDLTRIGRNVINGQRTVFPVYVWPDFNQITPLTPGRPKAYLTDDYLTLKGSDQKITLRFDRVPTSVENGVEVQLRVARLPLVDPAKATLKQCPEVPEEHQLDLLDWAAYRALRNYDADAESRNKAEDFKKSFDDATKQLRDEFLRKVFAPHGWGFGANGWAWEQNSGSEW